MEIGSLMKVESIAECSPYIYTVKPVLGDPSKIDKTKVLMEMVA